MTATQFHRPHAGESFTTASGASVTIDAVYYEVRRETFRISWLDPDAPQGRRGGTIERDDSGPTAGWRLCIPERGR